ncbi:hypothetical protein ACO1M6_13970, partial [Staphylococcus aureus]
AHLPMALLQSSDVPSPASGIPSVDSFRESIRERCCMRNPRWQGRGSFPPIRAVIDKGGFHIARQTASGGRVAGRRCKRLIL